MSPCKNKFWHPSLVIYFFATHKTETGTKPNRSGTINSKPPGPIIMMSQSETLSSSQIIFVLLLFAAMQYCWAFHQPPQTLFYSFLQPCRIAEPFTSHHKPCKQAEPKPFSWPKPANLDFSSSNFTVQITYRAPLEMLLHMSNKRYYVILEVFFYPYQIFMQWLQDLCLIVFNVWVKWFMFMVHMNGIDDMWLLCKNSMSMYLWIYSDLTSGGCVHLIIVKKLRFSILVIGHFFLHWFQKIILTFVVEGFTLPLVLLLMYYQHLDTWNEYILFFNLVWFKTKKGVTL